MDSNLIISHFRLVINITVYVVLIILISLLIQRIFLCRTEIMGETKFKSAERLVYNRLHSKEQTHVEI
jgi:hypothetical protein